MEKDDLNELIELFRNELRDNIFSQNFFISLSEGIFYQIDEDRIFTFEGMSLMTLSTRLSEYINKEFFKNDDKFDYIRYYKTGKMWDGVSPVTKTVISGNLAKKDGFLVLLNSKENLEYIKSISRDNKINKIIK